MSCPAPLTHVPGTAPQQLTVAISLSGNRATESHPLLTFQGHSPFAWYGPELACHVHHGGITGRHFVGDGIPRPDVAKRERIIMIAPNGRSAGVTPAPSSSATAITIGSFRFMTPSCVFITSLDSLL